MRTKINKTAASAALILSTILAGCSKSPQTVTTEHTVSAGETVAGSLLENGIAPQTAAAITANLQKVFNLRRSQEGDYYEVTTSTDGRLLYFAYYPRRTTQYYEISPSADGGWTAASADLPVEITTRAARGQVSASLWEAMSADGIEGELIIRFAELFSSQVDFFADTRRGDEFTVVWEEKTIGKDGRKRRLIEKIIAAEYKNRGESFVAVGFGADGFDYDYWSPDGKSLRLAFLRAPLSYRRISSHFARRRFHPILRIYRPHHGIDYAAPAGTPVSAIGDGTVSFRGWSGGYGNLVRIRHPNGYETCYGHLSRFAKISAGSRVKQGQVVGYVGSTGDATGPHLHFEIRQGGRAMNFLSLRLPSQKQIPQALKADFASASDEVKRMLSEIR